MRTLSPTCSGFLRFTTSGTPADFFEESIAPPCLYSRFNNNRVENIYVQMHLCILSFTPNTRFYISHADRWEPEHGSVDPTVPFLASYTVLCNRTNVQSCNVLIFLGDVLDLDLVASQLGFWYKVNSFVKSYRSE